MDITTMITIRKAQERGHLNHGWLETHHTFSFASYHDPDQMGFRSLRVMNEDFVAPGRGFGKHPHENMEIVTYVLEGALEHRDSLGNGEILSAGEFQRMSAGTGITHSEFNPSPQQKVHLYQIWLFPDREGIKPSYEQKRFTDTEQRNRLCLVASPDTAAGSLRIHQDARIYLTRLDDGREVRHELAAGRGAWLQVLRGSVTVGTAQLSAGDGAAISDQSLVTIEGNGGAEVMLFDLA
jgi:redox-sensitive bicupin YhaK (pirin superfamily)